MTSQAATPQQTRYYRMLANSGTQFWTLHTLGWLGISLVTYISLSLPYDQFELSYLAHNLSQSAVGMIVSLPMRYVYRAVWGWRPWPRLAVIIGTALSLSVIWAVLRLLLFMLMTDEEALWGDFGGWLFPSIFVFLTWAALYHGIKYYRLLQHEHEMLLEFEAGQRREALRLAEAKAEARDAQLMLLRYQLNPHFLFNTLNSVMALIQGQRARDAQGMLLRLSTFLRFSLDGDRSSIVPLQEELEALTLYLEIEQVRFADRLRLEIDVEEQTKTLAVPSLLLQPLVENSIKYAIAQAESGGVIRVSAQQVGARLVLWVEDSGPDLNPERVEGRTPVDGQGIGLKNTRARLANLYNDDGFALEVTDSSLGGVAIRIEIPATEVIRHERAAGTVSWSGG